MAAGAQGAAAMSTDKPIANAFFTRAESSVVMAGHSRPKDSVASLTDVPAIHALLCSQDVDARHKAGHDVERLVLTKW